MVCEVRGSQQGSIDQLYRQPSPDTPDPFTTPGAARARSTPAPRPRPRPGTRRGATRRGWRGRRRWKPTRWWGWWRRWRRRGTSWPWPWAWPRHPPRRARMNQDELRRQMDLSAEDARQRSVGRRIAGITHTNTVTTVYVCPPPTRCKKTAPVPYPITSIMVRRGRRGGRRRRQRGGIVSTQRWPPRRIWQRGGEMLLFLIPLAIAGSKAIAADKKRARPPRGR